MTPPTSTYYDRCVRDLELRGHASLPLPPPPSIGRDCGPPRPRSSTACTAPARAFDVARRALNVLAAASFDSDSGASAVAPRIDPATDPRGWTGHHHHNVLCNDVPYGTNSNVEDWAAGPVHGQYGRYNAHREGFVFSDGGMFDAALEDGGERGGASFEVEMRHMFELLHDQIALGVLGAIERRLELPVGYFQKEVGPTGDASQWHVKRYVRTPRIGESSHSNDPNKSTPHENPSVPNEPENWTQRREVLLPVHTDPSLISIVIIDREGRHKGGMGLEVFRCAPHTGALVDGSAKSTSSAGNWEEVSHHGHDVAIIFVGSVLSYLTRGQEGSYFPAAKHRVVGAYDNDISNPSNARMAATLFVRPRPDAVMNNLPSRRLQGSDHGVKKPTFGEWNRRVAKNYMKSEKKKKDKQQSAV
ncbi:hypothetical protein ACHAWF_003096 [Thalassiosira exigua]